MADRPATQQDMIKLIGLTIKSRRVLDAMAHVPRDWFVPEAQQHLAYADRAVPLGDGQTISQPLVVATMLEAIAPQPHHRLLEIGTGSGYVAALLGELGARVVSIERNHRLANDARQRLRALGHANVRVIEGDGTLGWPDGAPYDGIVVSAFGPAVPEALRQQLALGGRLVMPVGSSRGEQQLQCMTRIGDMALATEDLGPVLFVPLIGAEGWPEQPAT
ncbi:protein-L-isoaspartate(D-aspartate) O-methyltransferase [Devosia lacusdianchii]|uniref:protein-L-isoaspartate(D-aspartate) O-methyltransferase n=1 Tax=Devosia lacusdianchii TaxID=2917991 RepID=UPI001F0705DA|nr:protein-L-isoaspartate(D-aspartate) O-methyltransferase [Devosia sp. JXJ CY 41]